VGRRELSLAPHSFAGFDGALCASASAAPTVAVSAGETSGSSSGASSTMPPVPTEPVPTEPLPVTVEPEREDDRAAIRQVHLAAFAHHLDVADLVERLREVPQYVPELSLVARHEGSAVGHVMLTHAQVVPDDGAAHRVLLLSPLGVLPAVQRRGVGSALVRASLSAADAFGESIVLLQGSPRYYPRFGFVDCRTLGITMDLPDWAPREAGQAYPLSTYRPDVVGHVVEPAPFAELP
jgi:putative acetyltransferase